MQKKVPALNSQQVGAIREPGLEETLEVTNPILPPSSHDLPPGVCTAARGPAEPRPQPLSPAQQRTPLTLPREAGTRFTLQQRHCWIKPPTVQSVLCMSLRVPILVLFLFICCSRTYMKHLVLHMTAWRSIWLLCPGLTLPRPASKQIKNLKTLAQRAWYCQGLQNTTETLKNFWWLFGGGRQLYVKT